MNLKKKNNDIKLPYKINMFKKKILNKRKNI